MREQINAQKNNPKTDVQGGGEKKKCNHCEAVRRTAPHQKGGCLFNPKKNMYGTAWVKELMKAKGVEFEDD